MFLVSRVLWRILNDASNPFKNTETFPNFGRGSEKDRIKNVSFILWSINWGVLLFSISIYSHLAVESQRSLTLNQLWRHYVNLFIITWINTCLRVRVKVRDVHGRGKTCGTSGSVRSSGMLLCLCWLYVCSLSVPKGCLCHRFFCWHAISTKKGKKKCEGCATTTKKMPGFVSAWVLNRWTPA